MVLFRQLLVLSRDRLEFKFRKLIKVPKLQLFEQIYNLVL